MAALLRLLVLALAIVSTSGLRVFVGSARATAVRSGAASMMALPKIEDARALSTEEIEAEIAMAKKVRSRALRRVHRHHISPLAIQSGAACAPPDSTDLPLAVQPIDLRCVPVLWPFPSLQELFELRKKVKTRQTVSQSHRSACATTLWNLRRSRAHLSCASAIRR